MKGVFAQWWHCLVGMFGRHRATTYRMNGRVIKRRCECGRVFYSDPRAQRAIDALDAGFKMHREAKDGR